MVFDWMKVEGRGHSDEERVWFKEWAYLVNRRFTPGTVIVNIGVFKGCSMHCFRSGAPNATLYGIDVKVYKTVRPDILNARIIRANSTTYHGLFHRDIHLLFIDGSHRPEDVLKDVAGWSPKVVIGGILAFHDYERTPEEHTRRPVCCGTRQLIGVAQAVDEWWARGEVQMRWEKIRAVGSIRAFERVMHD